MKNAKYKEQLQRAKKTKSRNSSRNSSRDMKRSESKRSLGDSFTNNGSYLSNNLRNSARRAPRKSIMLFMDVRNKLNLICSESEEMKKNVANMAGEIERKDSIRRASLMSNGFNDFREIKEVEEEEDEESAMKIKDELTSYKERLQEYSEIMKEMTEQFDIIEEDNKVLEEELEKYEGFYMEEKEKGRVLMEEKEVLKNEYLGVLEMYEQKEIEREELVQRIKEMEQDQKKNSMKVGEKEIVMLKDNEELFKENKELVEELDTLKKRLSKMVYVKSSVEEMNKEVESSHKDLAEKLKMETHQKEMLMKKLKIIAEDQDTNRKLMEQQQREEIEQMGLEMNKLKSDNRELRNENLELEDKIRQLELKSMELPQNDFKIENDTGMMHLGSQLENNNIMLDINETEMNSMLKYEIGSVTDYFSKKPDEFPTSTGMFDQEDEDFGLETKSQGRVSVRDIDTKMYLSKPIDEDIFDELNEKNQEITHLKTEKENILRQKKTEMDSLRSKIIQIQKDCNFELEGMKRRMKHEGKIFKKEKRKMEREINGLQARVVQLKVKTSNTMVMKDEIEVKFVKKLRLLQNKIKEYEAMIREHNLMTKKKKNQGFFRSILNF
jgi:hypothetical protein